MLQVRQLIKKIIDAYNFTNGSDRWDRDYIYYNIKEEGETGPMLFNFQEHLTAFRLNGDPTLAYNKISDQTGDPTYKPTTTDINSGWTGGGFEIKVRVLFNSLSGAGSELVTFMPVLPTNLFNLTYTAGPFYYTVSGITLKDYLCQLPLFHWDLQTYATSIKIEIEEVDLSTTTTSTDTRVVKYANNFNLEGSLWKKINIKFGSVAETTQTSSVTKTFTEGNDQLGAVIVNFADKIIVNHTSSITGITGSTTSHLYTTREYPTGWFVVTVEPKKIQ